MPSSLVALMLSIIRVIIPCTYFFYKHQNYIKINLTIDIKLNKKNYVVHLSGQSLLGSYFGLELFPFVLSPCSLVYFIWIRQQIVTFPLIYLSCILPELYCPHLCLLKALLVGLLALSFSLWLFLSIHYLKKTKFHIRIVNFDLLKFFQLSN